MAISKSQIEESYKQQYGEDIVFTEVRNVKTGGIFRRKHFVVASVAENGMTPGTEQEDSHRRSRVKYYVLPIKSGKIAAPGMLFDLRSYDAYNMRYVNTEGANEVWRTCEVFLDITSGTTELAQIRSSGTGDTPYVDAADNIQIQGWVDRHFPVYDFVISTGLSEQEELYLNDNDIRKRKSLIYKFV